VLYATTGWRRDHVRTALQQALKAATGGAGTGASRPGRGLRGMEDVKAAVRKVWAVTATLG
jgi:hypothetical protein